MFLLSLNKLSFKCIFTLFPTSFSLSSLVVCCHLRQFCSIFIDQEEDYGDEVAKPEGARSFFMFFAHPLWKEPVFHHAFLLTNEVLRIARHDSEDWKEPDNHCCDPFVHVIRFSWEALILNIFNLPFSVFKFCLHFLEFLFIFFFCLWCCIHIHSNIILKLLSIV